MSRALRFVPGPTIVAGLRLTASWVSRVRAIASDPTGVRQASRIERCRDVCPGRVPGRSEGALDGAYGWAGRASRRRPRTSTVRRPQNGPQPGSVRLPVGARHRPGEPGRPPDPAAAGARPGRPARGGGRGRRPTRNGRPSARPPTTWPGRSCSPSSPAGSSSAAGTWAVPPAWTTWPTSAWTGSMTTSRRWWTTSCCTRAVRC